MSDARVLVTKALDGLLEAGLVVAGLVGRDGLPLIVRARRPVQEETFSAMSAALLASAEATLQEVAPARNTVVLAQSGETLLGVAGVDDSHLLACIAPAAPGIEALRKRLDDATGNLRKALGG